MQLKMLINIRRTLTLCLVTLIHISMEVLAACKSPIDVSGQQGVETARVRGSRTEYDPLPDRLSLRPRSRIEIEFKATSTSGVLFAALDYEDQDVVSALLHSGYIIFARQCGYGNIVEIFRKKLDRFRWHRLRYIHDENGGNLIINGQNGHFRHYHMGPCAHFRSLFLGGLPEQIQIINWPGTQHLFVGCIRNLKINGRRLEDPPRYYYVSVCEATLS